MTPTEAKTELLAVREALEWYKTTPLQGNELMWIMAAKTHAIETIARLNAVIKDMGEDADVRQQKPVLPGASSTTDQPDEQWVTECLSRIGNPNWYQVAKDLALALYVKEHTPPMRESSIASRLALALDHLLGLKRYKDQKGKDAYYEKQQPLAWEKARQVLLEYKALNDVEDGIGK